MDDYKELIERLLYTRDDGARDEAADAIESLLAENERLKPRLQVTEPVDVEPAMWVMKHIRSGDLAQAKPNQKALHPYMWSDAFPRYTTPQPDRTAELEAALKVARDALRYYGGDKYGTFANEAYAKINEVLK